MVETEFVCQTEYKFGNETGLVPTTLFQVRDSGGNSG